MAYKFGEFIVRYNIDVQRLAIATGRSRNTIHHDAFVKGVTNRFIAMGYAYALNCEYTDIIEGKITNNNTGWVEQCLPHLD